ncbi:HD-GYP domain-containing protein [Pseudoalteromonas fenneropenaei]|uniref:HD-GYP domain-containing protein n=1 Tax=Pseudoalteromonas fenneropenaei TaxID=1737459 RepID=A0ABV7CJ41_9GAMM
MTDAVQAPLDDALPLWRKLIFKRLFGILALICIPVYFTSIYLCWQLGLYAMIVLDTISYAVLVAILYLPNLPDKLRYGLGCMLAYVIGIAFIWTVGPAGAGFMWLFAFTPLVAILLGQRASFYALGLQTFSLILIGICYHLGLLHWENLAIFNTTIWWVLAVNFIATNAMVTLSIGYLTRRLIASLASSLASRQATVYGLAKLAEYRDNETGAHLLRMRQYAELLACTRQQDSDAPAELNEQFIANISLSAILHDIGKVGVADAILLKPGRLSSEEFEQIKAHPVIGGHVLESLMQYAPNCGFLAMGRDIAAGHHEKWDGSGYPLGLRGEAIPLSARIVALVDVYDALTTPRCYKRPFSHEEAKTLIVEGKGKHFDPNLVECFLRVEAKFAAISATALENP